MSSFFLSTAGKDIELSAVEAELDRVTQGKEQEAGVKEQQLSLFNALTRDLSEPTIDLIAKLNCQTKRAICEVIASPVIFMVINSPFQCLLNKSTC